LFTAVFSHTSCPASCASAAHTVCKDNDVTRKQVVTFNYVLN
jgi:hypothetical protein